MNRLLLQAPGVAQDLFGQLHVRGDHANLQYRLNGVILPEGINVFGQALQTRLAQSVSLITGALPAQYGLRTAGIIDIQTKTGTLDPGRQLYALWRAAIDIPAERRMGRRVGQVDYFVTGEVLHNAEGIENPAPHIQRRSTTFRRSRAALPMSPASSIRRRACSAIFGVSRSEYQIPNNPGQTRASGLPSTASAISIRRTAQREPAPDHRFRDRRVAKADRRIRISRFRLSPAIAASILSPDPVGDMLFNGIAQTASCAASRTACRATAAIVISAEHTLRSGFFIQRNDRIRHQRKCLPVDDERHADHRPAAGDLRFRGQRDRLALQLLSTGRMEDRADS